MIHLEELTDYLQGKENIYLYGAGFVSKRLTAYLESKDFKICGYIITKKSDSSLEYNGKPLFETTELHTLQVSSIHVVVAVKGRCLDIKQSCVSMGFQSILFLSEKLLEELSDWEFAQTYRSLQPEYVLESKRPKLERDMGLIFDKQTRTPLFRAFRYKGYPDFTILTDYCTRNLFENQFGPLHVLPSQNSPANETRPSAAENRSSNNESNTVELYVATSHLDSMRPEQIQSENRIPLQVGAGLTDIRKGCRTDDTGIHISMKNQDFCECTGLYWIWKNTSGQNYVGLEQYRRRLRLNNQDFSRLEEGNLDAVLALPQFVMKKVKTFFAGDLIPEYDWQLMREFILKYDKNYQSILDEYEESWFYFSCNLFLFRRKWFDLYCEFAFSAALEIDRFYGQRGIIRQDRYMGYLFENLLSIFIMRHYKEMNVVCTEVEWLE